MTSGIGPGVSAPTRFIVLATQRTGSTWLSDMLDSHPAIAAYEELFLAAKAHTRTWGRADREFFHDYYDRRAGRRLPLARVFLSLRYLEELYAPRSATEAVGLKLMYGQLQAHPWLIGYMPARRVRVVHLVRTNLLDLVLSRAAAEARNQYHALGSDRVDESPVHLPAEQLASQFETIQRSVDKIRLLLRFLPTPSIEISYEELAAGDDALQNVLRFLNVAPHRLTSRLAKLNRDTKQALIANYGEVERALRGTRFEHFLAE